MVDIARHVKEHITDDLRHFIYELHVDILLLTDEVFDTVVRLLNCVLKEFSARHERLRVDELVLPIFARLMWKLDIVLALLNLVGKVLYEACQRSVFFSVFRQIEEFLCLLNAAISDLII